MRDPKRILKNEGEGEGEGAMRCEHPDCVRPAEQGFRLCAVHLAEAEDAEDERAEDEAAPIQTEGVGGESSAPGAARAGLASGDADGDGGGSPDEDPVDSSEIVIEVESEPAGSEPEAGVMDDSDSRAGLGADDAALEIKRHVAQEAIEGGDGAMAVADATPERKSRDEAQDETPAKGDGTADAPDDGGLALALEHAQEQVSQDPRINTMLHDMSSSGKRGAHYLGPP